MSNVHDAMTAKAIAVGTSGVVVAGGSSIPAQKYQEIPRYGEALVNNGFWLLSWAEWIQVIGCIYVLSLLVKTIIIPVISPALKKLIEVCKNEFF